ncbi:hypothetical protein ACJ41O_007249 [Fusarium nematophilum]
MHFAKIFLSGIFIASVQALAFPEYPGMLEGRGESRLSPRLSPVRRLPRTPCTYKDTAPGGEGGCEFHCILEQADSWDLQLSHLAVDAVIVVHYLAPQWKLDIQRDTYPDPSDLVSVHVAAHWEHDLDRDAYSDTYCEDIFLEH